MAVRCPPAAIFAHNHAMFATATESTRSGRSHAVKYTTMGRRPLLTKEQVHVALQRFTAGYGRAPSVEELRRELRVGSTRTIFRYLQMLEDQGTIARRPG